MAAPEMTREGVILLGAQRSGTTPLARALQDAFAQKGGLFTVNAKLAYYLLRWLTPGDILAQHLRDDEIIHALSRRPPNGPGADLWMARARSAVTRAAGQVSRSRGGSPVALAREIMAEVYDGFPMWGEKYNEMICNLPGYASILPESRYLVIVRHPAQQARAIVAWHRNAGWRPTEMDDALRKWTAWHRLLLDFVGAISADRLKIVLYEDLSKPAVQAEIAAFVGISTTEHFRFLDNRDLASVDPVCADGGELSRALDLWSAFAHGCRRPEPSKVVHTE